MEQQTGATAAHLAHAAVLSPQSRRRLHSSQCQLPRRGGEGVFRGGGGEGCASPAAGDEAEAAASMAAAAAEAAPAPTAPAPTAPLLCAAMLRILTDERCMRCSSPRAAGVAADGDSSGE